MKTVIRGIGSYLPEKEVSSDEMERMAGYEKLGVKIGLCKMLTGCESRHWSQPEELCSDIAAKAGKAALENAGISPDEVDALIFASVSHDFVEPATSNVVADKLGVKNAFCFDIKNACNAFLSAVDISDSFIKTGKIKTALVVSGEALTKWTKFNYTEKEELVQRAPVALSVGDGGGAFVLQASEEENSGIVTSVFRTVPGLWNNNVIWGGGVAFPGDPEKMYIPGTTKAIIDQIMGMTDYIPQILKKSGWTLEDIDYVVPTQVAKWIVKHIRESLGLDEDKIIQIVKTTGNMGASNVPVAADFALKDGRLKKGSKILMIGGAVGVNLAMMTAVL